MRHACACLLAWLGLLVFFYRGERTNKHTQALTNRFSPFFLYCCLHGFHAAQSVFPWTCSRLLCSARSLHSLMPSCDMVCGVSCLCSRLGLLGLSCGCFLFAWLCPVCEDTVLLRLLLLCAPVSAVDDCRGLGLADSFFSLYRKKGEALALASIFACIACYLYSPYGRYRYSVACQLLSFSRHICLRALGLHVSVFLRIGVWA